MDALVLRQRGKELFTKYRYVLLVLAVGLILMSLPESKENTAQPVVESGQPQQTVAQELEDILSRIQGAGKVQVMLTQYRGSETVYQTDTDHSADVQRSDTVILSGSDRGETGLVRQVNPPVYLGALVVCQGGDSPTVKLAIVEAVMSVTGLKSNEITVLKMK